MHAREGGFAGSPGELEPPMNLPFRLLVITDRSLMGSDPAKRVIELAKAKVPGWALQWRDPQATPADLYRDLLAVREQLAGTSDGADADQPTPQAQTNAGGQNGHAESRLDEANARVTRVRESDAHSASRMHAGLRIFVNDRVDVAAALRLDAHLKETSLPTRAARALLPSPALLGKSVHSVSSATIASEEGADYVLFGPIFDTPSKRAFGPPQGLDALRTVAATVPIPVFAVGGVDGRTADQCIAAGAAGIAVIRAVWDHSQPMESIREILGALPS